MICCGWLRQSRQERRPEGNERVRLHRMYFVHSKNVDKWPPYTEAYNKFHYKMHYKMPLHKMLILPLQMTRNSSFLWWYLLIIIDNRSLYFLLYLINSKPWPSASRIYYTYRLFCKFLFCWAKFFLINFFLSALANCLGSINSSSVFLTLSSTSTNHWLSNSLFLPL